MPAAAPQQNALPPGLHLPAGWIVRVSAVDATTGAAVAGVVLRNVSLDVTDVGGGGLEGLVSGEFQLVLGPGTTV